MGVNSLPKTVTRQRRDCDLIPGPSAPESIHVKCTHAKSVLCIGMSQPRCRKKFKKVISFKNVKIEKKLLNAILTSDYLIIIYNVALPICFK